MSDLVKKDLGTVSAYKYAKLHGYTGTEDEFARLMASYATVAEQASQSAQTASEKASEASQNATSASQSADTASASATSAQASATTATAKASEAQQGATTATTKAQEASQSASESSQSASTAVQAKQDAQTAQTASETAQTSAESARDDAETARDAAQQYAESINPEKLIGAYPVDTATGSIASFTDGADDIPMKSVKVRIEPVQDLHGQDAPYPAGGGKNKIVYPYYDGSSKTINGVTFTVGSDGTVTANGTATANAEFYIARYIDVNFPAGTYTFSGLPSGASPTTFVYNSYAGSGSNTGSDLWDFRTYSDRTVTVESEIKNFTLAIRIISGYTANDLVFKPMFENGSSASTFAPYSNICPISGWDSVQVSHSGADRTNPTTKTIPLPQTVYGGTLDVTNGVLTVDRAMVDLGTLIWNKKVSGIFYAWDLRNLAKAVSASQTANAKCSSLKLGSYIDVYDNATLDYAISVGTNSQLGVQCSAYAEATDFKSAMNGVQFCYELATTITIQLTPHQINSLYGANNLWADSGDTEVEYRANTTLWVQKKITEAVAAALNS